MCVGEKQYTVVIRWLTLLLSAALLRSDYTRLYGVIPATAEELMSFIFDALFQFYYFLLSAYPVVGVATADHVQCVHLANVFTGDALPDTTPPTWDQHSQCTGQCTGLCILSGCGFRGHCRFDSGRQRQVKVTKTDLSPMLHSHDLAEANYDSRETESYIRAETWLLSHL